MPAIFADSYGGLQQGIASDRASRENDLRQALQMVVQRNQEMQRRRELRDAIAMHQQQQDIANEMARRTFDEQVREFNVGNQTRIDEANLRRQANTEKTDVIPPSIIVEQMRQAERARAEAENNNQAAAQGAKIANVENTRTRLNRDLVESEKSTNMPLWKKWLSVLAPLSPFGGKNILEQYYDRKYEQPRQVALRERLATLPTLQRNDIQDYTEVDPRSGYRVPLYRPMTNTVPQGVNYPPRRMLNFNPGGMPTGTNAMPIGPVIDVPSTVQTQTLTAPNPYAPGKRYGNLRYLGGDPNLETSWQPVQ